MNHTDLSNRLELTVGFIKEHINALSRNKEKERGLLHKINNVQKHSLLDKITKVLDKRNAQPLPNQLQLPSIQLQPDHAYTYEQHNTDVINTGVIKIPFLQRR